MTFEIKNSTGGSITLGGTTYAGGAWVSILPYWAYGNMEATQNDVDGPNAGRSLNNGTMIRDRVGMKQKVNFVSIPTTHANCTALMALAFPESFTIRTDFFTGTTTEYTVYSNNRVLTHVVSRTGSMLCKCSFPIIEM